MDFIKHTTNTITEVISENKDFDGATLEFISISVKNIGNIDNITVNDFPLNTGDPMLSYENEIPHIDKTNYKIRIPSGGKAVIIYKKVTKSIVVAGSNQSTKKC